MLACKCRELFLHCLLNCADSCAQSSHAMQVGWNLLVSCLQTGGGHKLCRDFDVEHLSGVDVDGCLLARDKVEV